MSVTPTGQHYISIHDLDRQENVRIEMNRNVNIELDRKTATPIQRILFLAICYGLTGSHAYIYSEIGDGDCSALSKCLAKINLFFMLTMTSLCAIAFSTITKKNKDSYPAGFCALIFSGAIMVPLILPDYYIHKDISRNHCSHPTQTLVLIWSIICAIGSMVATRKIAKS